MPKGGISCINTIGRCIIMNLMVGMETSNVISNFGTVVIAERSNRCRHKEKSGHRLKVAQLKNPSWSRSKTQLTLSKKKETTMKSPAEKENSDNTKLMVVKCCACKETQGCKSADGTWEKICLVDCLCVLDCFLLDIQEPTDKIAISYGFCEICFNDRFRIPSRPDCAGNRLLPVRER